MPNILRKIATLVSYFLHPMLMPTYVLYLLLHSKLYMMIPIPDIIVKYIYGLIICFTILLPLSFTLYLKKTGVISSLRMEEQHERTTPFLFTIGCYFGAFYVLNKTSLTIMLTVILLGAIASLVLLIIGNKFSKISAHTVGIGGVLGSLLCVHFFLSINLLPLILGAILFCGIVGSSRLILKAHLPHQIYIGILFGICGQLIVFTFYKYYIFGS